MIQTNDVLQYLKGVLTDMKDIDEDDIRMDSTLEEIALDSLDYVEVQLAVKKRYGVVVNQTAFSDGSIRTIGDFCSYVTEAMPTSNPVLAAAVS